MTLGYAMMDALVLGSYYTDADDSAVVIDGEDGCTSIILSEPKFGHNDGKLTFETRIKVALGKKMFGRCVSVLNWDRYLFFVEKPILDKENWSLSFEIDDFVLMTANRKPVKLAGMVWKIIRDDVNDYLGGIKIDLAPPMRDLRDVLLPLLGGLQAEEALRLVESIRPGSITILPDALKLENSVEIQDEWLTALIEAPIEGEEAALTGKEVDAFISTWEAWDTYLIQILLSLSGKPLIDEERQLFLDTVLDVRYEFIDELGRPVMQKDFVRRQFVETWTNIQPVFRRHLLEEKSSTLFGYLAFFSASDALVSLDTAAPSLGIEISNEGFNRLARMLITEEVPEPVSPERQDPRLRQLFGMPPWSEEPFTQNSGMLHTGRLSYLANLYSLFFSVSTAHASENNQPLPAIEEISQWVYDRSDMESYSEKIRELLSPIAQSALQQSVLPEQYRPMFQRLVLATAWQESCFRQFIRGKDDTIKYLTSYNGTSVGLMQINERVWKGIYDVESLRWKIEYNAKAGCEILDTYFNRYALRYMKKMTPPPDLTEEQLSGAIYAMYNGGPKEFHKFISRSDGNSLYQSDRLFREKFEWANQSDWEKLSECLR